MATQYNQSQYISKFVPITHLQVRSTSPTTWLPDPGEHVLTRSATATGEQDFPVKWFKFIHPSPKPRMTETPVQKPVHVAYSLIAYMNYQWTINLHDGYPLLQGMQPEEYIPPSLHILCNHEPTMFHLGDDYLCPSKILLPPGDNGENLEAAANKKNEINDDLYRFRTLNVHQGPPKAPDPNLKSTSIMSLLQGRLGKRSMNLSQS